MSLDRLRRLQELGQLLQLRLHVTQLRAMPLRRTRDDASGQAEGTASYCTRLEADWRQALTKGQPIEPATIHAWQSLTSRGQARRDVAEQELGRAQSALDTVEQELRRHLNLSERSNAMTERERRAVARKAAERTLGAILERHSSRDDLR